ncbi:MAG: GNAT family N-acetyltransferase [archaeon]
MKVEETNNLEKIEGLCADHPYITKPTENPEKRNFYFLKYEGEVIGCGYTRIFFKKIGSLGGTFVKKEWRGKGAAEYFVREMEKRMEEKGVKICVFGVHKDNKTSINFNKKIGYHVLMSDLGKNMFNKPKLRWIVKKVSPAPIPKSSVVVLGKRLGTKEGEDTHILKELRQLEDYINSINIENKYLPMIPRENRISHLIRLKDIISLLNCGFGLYSIYFFILGNFEIGVYMLLAAVIMDILDGKVARTLSNPTEYGKRMDIADLVSFGVAPAVLIITWLNPTTLFENIVVHLSAVSIMFAEVLRLARFQTKKATGNYFSGLPGTATGIIYPTLYLLSPGIYLTTGISFIIAFLMVSSFKFPVKSKN